MIEIVTMTFVIYICCLAMDIKYIDSNFRLFVPICCEIIGICAYLVYLSDAAWYQV